MRKIILLFLGLISMLIITGCGGPKLTPAQSNIINNRTELYTQIPMWELKGVVNGINYKTGNLIPINSKVRILGLSADTIDFEYNGNKIRYLVMIKYSKVDAAATLDRTFGKDPVNLSLSSMENVANIANAKLANGMTKAEVVLARGYPPFHKTKSLNEDKWVYWNDRRANAAIIFKNDQLVSAPESLAPIATVAVKDIYKTNYGQKLPYTFKLADKEKPNSFALVIGINKYQQNTPVEFADKSAMAFAELANKTFGIPRENIITLTNEEATSGQLKAKFELLKELADPRGNIYIYYAGHGVPGKDGNTYLLPYDMSADAIHLEQNLRIDSIYEKFSKLNVQKVFVFMDSCFSGKDDEGGLLYKGVAPVLRTKKTVVDDRKMTILTAGQSTDFANDLKEKQQRMFSYYLIDSLSKGETNIAKIYPNLQSDVKRASLFKGLGYKQIPQLYGNEQQKLY